MKHKKTVLLGLSGGVDSAVAAYLLKKKGYKVITAFMKNFSETKNKLTGECNWVQDKKDAQKIAAKLKIDFIFLDFEKEYKTFVISPMFKSYSLGLTPNPDSLCNKIIKFPLLWKHAKKLKCDFIATGHYIKKIKRGNSFLLKIPKDKSKDQSYFLYDLTQEDLQHTLFPLADLTKNKVRKIANSQGFHNYDKKGTSGICFVGKINMKDFLKQKIKPKPGKIISVDGEIIGKHPGISYYTIGERIKENKNITINKEFRNKYKTKIYVSEKNKRTNTLIVAPENHPKLKKKEFYIKKINFVNSKPKFPLKCKIRIRHLGELMDAKISTKNKKYFCKVEKGIQGLAEGQSCVFYKRSILLGGGEIRFN